MSSISSGTHFIRYGGTTWASSIEPTDGDHGLCSGPFVMWKGQLCKAFRLYDHPQQAFIVAIRPRILKRLFRNLRASGNLYTLLSVAVPSRIDYLSKSTNSLAGARLAVKEVFEIEGLRLTVGCRAWYDLYTPAEKIAPVIHKPLDKDTTLVGTLKLGSLITREELAESADYFAPFNQRGDGHQSAWSSSGGSGAALASYDWLDFTLGTYKLEQFRQEYRTKHLKEPYVNPVMRWRWEAAKNVTQEQHEDAVQRLHIYKELVIEKALQVNGRHAIILLSIITQAVDYRDASPDPSSAPNAFDGIWLAPILGAPELSIPIGEMEYVSDLSKRIERLPIVVSLLGASGTDMELIGTARRTLEQSGRAKVVATGSRIDIGDKYIKWIADES
ncbi:hypothetical protein BS50DRAFT_634027 [Corynespora cassiicola Philippines]|uniref:Amidase signature enzyme n=1 Tax=Corynespora cassiicola Philippines TaxID=1448308 RepID=A0A2T2NT53_CORCC|nr:hypothetical protein BS50DRAFT_634027 [Corynespora cassiicola Philippines]